jgi:intracellular proteinase inhibitor BsuPI
VPLVFRVANPGPAAVTLQLQGREPTADFEVTDSAGRVVWTRLKGQTVLGVLRLYPLAPRQTLTFRHVWNQRSDAGRPLPPGEYRVRGILLTDHPGDLASPSATVRIAR